MCDIGSILPEIGDAIAVAAGNPELVPLIQGAGTAAVDLSQGDSLGKSLGQGAIQGAGAFAGQEIAPVIGNALGSSTFGGANSLTDLVGQTTDGGSLAGAGTIGGDVLGNFTPGSGLASLLGGTAAPTGSLSSLANGEQYAPPAPAAADAAATAAPQAAAAQSAGAITPNAGGGGAGSIGGGAPTGLGSGGQVGEDIGNTGSAIAGEGANATPPTDISPSASTLSPASENFFNNLSNPLTSPTGTNFTGNDALSPSVINADNATASSLGQVNTLTQQGALASLMGSTANVPQAGAGGSMTASLLGGGGSAASPINGLINGGLSYLLGNNNQHGANQISGAAAQANANYAPYLAAGTGAENTLSNLYGNNGTAAQTSAMNNFQTTPGYQFALGQGLNAVNANAAAMGNPLSGNNEEAVNNYAQGTASQQYNNYVNQLQNLASGGMQAAGGTGANLLTGAGAQSQVGQNQANLQNTAIGTGLNALFPTGGFNLAQLLSGGNTGNSGAGLLGMFTGSGS